MGHGHVTPNADGSKARCGGPGFCSTCNAEREAVRRQMQGQADWQLVKDSRLVELIRGYIQSNSDMTTRPDMNSEEHLLNLMHLALDEEAALRQGEKAVAGSCKCGGSPHTNDCLFRHFMSYTGFWQLSGEEQNRIRLAYEDGIHAGESGKVEAVNAEHNRMRRIMDRLLNDTWDEFVKQIKEPE